MSQAIDLTDQVTKTHGVIESAIVALKGRDKAIADAVAAALAAGATTAKEMADAVTSILTDLGAETDALAAAIPSVPAPSERVG